MGRVPQSPPEHAQMGAMTARRTRARDTEDRTASVQRPRHHTGSLALTVFAVSAVGGARHPPGTRVSRLTRHDARG
jgi:hypothetical protein